jgi:hypothetical protein
LLERQHLLVWTDHLLHTTKSSCAEGLSHLVLAYVVRVTGRIAFGLGWSTLRLHF